MQQANWAIQASIYEHVGVKLLLIPWSRNDVVRAGFSTQEVLTVNATLYLDIFVHIESALHSIKYVVYHITNALLKFQILGIVLRMVFGSQRSLNFQAEVAKF